MSAEMNDFEKQLTQAMRRVDAPPKLARFLASAVEVYEERQQPRHRQQGWWTFFLPNHRAWAGGAVAALLVVGVVTGEQTLERARERRAVVMQQQFDTAMQITDHALDQTRVQLENVGLNFGD